ncbi:MAG: flavin reductase family protein [Clostridia bacterium]|nr:flavin reductase family protein [Clostridia bacterium]MBR6794640.1 flavin reductase family protein [Clostridia bacterium]
MGRVAWRGGTLLAPLPPALVSCGTGEEVNLLTVAWTGILSTVPPKTYISVRPSRHSYGLLLSQGEFVIHLPSAAMARTVDFCGMYTGAKVNKIERCGLHLTASKSVSVPTVSECPLALECRIFDRVPLGSHDMFLADVTAVTLDERLLDKNGTLHMERADLLAYAHGHYYALGQQIGKFGFSAVKKNSYKRKRNAKEIRKTK